MSRAVPELEARQPQVPDKPRHAGTAQQAEVRVFKVINWLCLEYAETETVSSIVFLGKAFSLRVVKGSTQPVSYGGPAQNIPWGAQARQGGSFPWARDAR